MLYQLDKLDGDIDFAALRAAKLIPRTAKQAKIVKKRRADQEAGASRACWPRPAPSAAIEAAGGKFEGEVAVEKKPAKLAKKAKNGA